ncbi:type III pantothenate kinase, partial [Nocardia salmonicida]|uniref:type III pantothenate kinase n=1 Tax=Nocardia salmonicida TaxID=53431 RepID=UPI00365041B9
MLLTIDVRNTGIELGLFSGSGEHAKLVRHWRIHTNPLITADEFAMQVRGLVGEDQRSTARHPHLGPDVGAPV